VRTGGLRGLLRRALPRYRTTRRIFFRLWAPVIPLALTAVASSLPSERPFERSYTYRGFKVRVVEDPGEARSIGTYTITVVRPDGKVTVAKGHRDGTVQEAWVADLSGEGGFEVAIATQSAGSGSYGALAVFRWTGTSLMLLNVADLSPAQKQGYRGHDAFRLDRGRIVRAFPVYRSDDPNAHPSGGTRRLVYDFRRNTWVPLTPSP
jgi:hypothetical protein